MSLKDLESKMQERIQQALNRRIFEKAYFVICNNLGRAESQKAKKNATSFVSSHIYSYQLEQLQFRLHTSLRGEVRYEVDTAEISSEFPISYTYWSHPSLSLTLFERNQPVLHGATDYFRWYGEDEWCGDEYVILPDLEPSQSHTLDSLGISLHAYIPGDWEKTLDQLYAEILRKQEEKEKTERIKREEEAKRREEERIRDIKKRFGL